MNLHEYQSKEVFREYGIPVPAGRAARSAEEAVAAAQELGGSLWVVKAQVHAGGRGKAGGVKLARDLETVRSATADMLGQRLVTKQTGPEGLPIETVYVEAGSQIERKTDTYSYEWLVVHDRDFEDLVTGVHLVASELGAHGFGEQLLAAIFSFGRRGEERPVYLIYGFKRGAFWPFVPTGKEQERDNAEELRLRNELQGELPFEEDLSRWLGLFDAPLD